LVLESLICYKHDLPGQARDKAERKQREWVEDTAFPAPIVPPQPIRRQGLPSKNALDAVSQASLSQGARSRAVNERMMRMCFIIIRL
jgi:hypothetical protein